MELHGDTQTRGEAPGAPPQVGARKPHAIDIDAMTLDDRPLMEVAAEHGVSRRVLYQRLYEDWHPRKAATTPTRPGHWVDGRRAAHVAAENGVGRQRFYDLVRRGTPAREAATRDVPATTFTREERATMALAGVRAGLARRRIEMGMDRAVAVSTPLPKFRATTEERERMRAAGVSGQLWRERMLSGWDRERATTEAPVPFAVRHAKRA